MSMNAKLDLFPAPSPSVTAHFRLPGPDADSTDALRTILWDNHVKHHGYFNRALMFQNHIAHHALAVWALGANRSVLEAAYHQEAPRQHPVIKAPGVITATNYNDHFGDDEYYSAYVEFYREKYEQNGASAVLDEFVFSPSANADSSQALSRFMDNLLHPMIHIGYGLEFGIPGLIVEGLALAAVLKGKRTAPLFPASLFENIEYLPHDLVPKLQALALDPTRPVESTQSGTPDHTFHFLDRILKDSTFDGPWGPDTSFDGVAKTYGKILAATAAEWANGITSTDIAAQKVEELQWTVSLLYAVTNFDKGKDGAFYADFAIMHLVTSSLFLGSYLHYISIASQKILLQSYFTVILAWWISRGRPKLDIAGFYAFATPTPNLPSLTVTPPSWSISPHPENPWHAICQHAIFHPDDHLCKIQRAFAHYATLYGGTPAGHFSNTTLVGADVLDGTLFIRAAGLTAERTSRASDEGKTFVWDVDWVESSTFESKM